MGIATYQNPASITPSAPMASQGMPPGFLLVNMSIGESSPIGILHVSYPMAPRAPMAPLAPTMIPNYGMPLM